MHISTTLLLLGIALCIHAESSNSTVPSNITIDNTSPLIVYSPPPCYVGVTPDCNNEWQLTKIWDAFNGSVTTTQGTDVAQGLTVVPRATFTFQGSSVVFMPGRHSTAAATIVVDSLSSILINTSIDAFSGTGLDPNRNHTISITFTPSDNHSTNLDIDFFVVIQSPSPTSASTIITPTVFTTSLIPTPTLTPTPTPTATTIPKPQILQQSSGVPSGTIAGLSTSAAILVLFGLLTYLLAARRRRRRAAFRREKAILYDLRLPSERSQKEWSIARVSRWGGVLGGVWGSGARDGAQGGVQGGEEGQVQGGEVGGEGPWPDAADTREKGKGRERTWRDSILPPVHYTPWR